LKNPRRESIGINKWPVNNDNTRTEKLFKY